MEWRESNFITRGKRRRLRMASGAFGLLLIVSMIVALSFPEVRRFLTL